MTVFHFSLPNPIENLEPVYTYFQFFKCDVYEQVLNCQCAAPKEYQLYNLPLKFSLLLCECDRQLCIMSEILSLQEMTVLGFKHDHNSNNSPVYVLPQITMIYDTQL